MKNMRKMRSLVYVVVTALLLLVVSAVNLNKNNVLAAAATVVTVVDTEGNATEVTEDESGTGWSWDASTSTLTLNRFSGQGIKSNGDINIHLVGENTITLVDTEDKYETGIIAVDAYDDNYKITVTAEDDGELNIVGTLTDSFHAIHGNLVFVNGKICVDVSTDISAIGLSMTSYGVYGQVEFAENETKLAQLDVGMEITGNKIGSLYGLGSGAESARDVIIKNRDNVKIDISLSVNNKYTILHGIANLNVINAAPEIKVALNCDSNNEYLFAVDNIEALDFRKGGSLTFTGRVQSRYVQYKTNVNTVTTTPSNNEFTWSITKLLGPEEYVLSDLNGEIIKNGKFEYLEIPSELKYNGANIGLPACKMSAYVKLNIRYFIVGVKDYNVYGDNEQETNNWKFEIIEGTLPGGVKLNTETGEISGYPDYIYPAGSVKIRATETAYTLDTSDDRSVEFVVPYGAVTTEKPVTGVDIQSNQIVLEQGEETTISAQVVPYNATIPDLNFTIDGVSKIISTTAKTSGVTECIIKADNAPGIAFLEATSVENGIFDNVYIYVKESIPNASQNEDYITNLEAGKSYLINNDEIIADENGCIAIEDAWRGMDISIIKKNAEELCNSDEQSLYIEKKIIKQNMVILEYSDTKYDNTEKTPRISVTYGEMPLAVNTDYIITYENNINAGTAKVTIEGTGIYKGTVVIEFTILPATIEGKQIILSETNYIYDGTAKTPMVTVEGLVVDADYTVTYKNNVNVGTATVVVTGKGNYTGVIERNFEITKPAEEPQQPDEPQQPEKPEQPQEPEQPGATEEKIFPAINVSYRTHIQTYGWEGNGEDVATWKSNGIMSGTSGEAKRLEGINIVVNSAEAGKDVELGIQYTTHCQSYGWLPWSANGDMNGTEGEAKRLEAIKIQLTGADKDAYDVYYRVHAQSYGWLGWAKNGAPAGTAGYAKRLEGIQIVVVKKNEKIDANIGNITSVNTEAYIAKEGKSPIVNYPATSNTNPVIPGENTPNVAYKTHVQSFGWQGWKYNGQMSGTSGLAKRLEGININLTNKPCEGDIVYTTHVQTYGWQGELDKPETWKKNGEMSGTSGEAKRLEAICIQLTGEMAEKYDVYYRVHAQTYGWLSWASNGAPAGTAGYAKRLEGIQVVIVPKGQKPDNTYDGITSTNTESYIMK